MSKTHYVQVKIKKRMLLVQPTPHVPKYSGDIASRRVKLF